MAALNIANGTNPVNPFMLSNPRQTPARRQRLTPKQLTDAAALLGSKFIQAQHVIKEAHGDRLPMKTWLSDNGMRLEPSSIYSEVNLQQLILYWHLLEAPQQVQIKLARPLFNFRVNQPTAGEIGRGNPRYTTSDGEEPRGAPSLCLVQEREVVPVISFRGKRYLQALKSRDNIAQKYLMLGEYDVAWAAVYQRWDLAGSVFPNPEGTSSLYGTCVFAHECVHMRQDLISNLYEFERSAATTRTWFNMLAGKDPTFIYRTTDSADEQSPADRTLPDIRRREERLEYAKGLRLTLASGTANDWLKTTLNLLDNNGVLITQVLDRISFAIDRVLVSLSDVVGAYAPFCDPEWIVNFTGLNIFIANDSPSSGVLETKYTPAVNISGRAPYASVIDTLEIAIGGQASLTLVRNQLQAEVKDLCIWGLTAVEAALKAFVAKLDRSVEVQKQTTQLFRSLVGRYTSYSDLYFRNAVTATKDRLQQVIMTGQGPILQYLPQPLRDSLPARRQCWTKAGINYATQEGLRGISDLDWYEMGAPLGFFNNYTREYDAETSAMWTMAPEEFLEMYRRGQPNKPSDAMMKEILNQATYASVRGIEEFGNVPDYYD